jgi:Fur family ferric uptake transcriptional regulator
MKVVAAETSPKMIRAFCRRWGLRLTAPREAILAELFSATDHPDAVELHRRVSAKNPRISLATVYRTLTLLRERGAIESHTFADGRARFEAAPREHHDHLIDVETGAVIEFRSDEIERLQEVIARRYGFEIVSHELDIYVRPIKGK